MRLFLSKRLMVILFLLIWLEFSVLPFISLREIKPDFFFIFLAFYAFRIDQRSVIPLAFFLGLVKDLITNSFFGLETASYVCGAVLLSFLAVRFDREKRWIQIASLFVFSWGTLVCFAVLALFVQRQYGLNLLVVAHTFLVAFYTSLLSFVFLPFLDRYVRPGLKQKQYELF